MTKRNMWTYEETLEMLNVMLEQESLKAMNGRPFRKDKAFRLVCEEMIQRGYNTKDPKQIENRWKNLKKRYMDLQRDPHLTEIHPFQYFDEIDVMMKGKPSTSESKLYELSITRVEPKQNVDTEDVQTKADTSSMQVDYEDETVISEEINQKHAPQSKPQPAKCDLRRSKRSKKRPAHRLSEAPKSLLPPPPPRTTTEQEAFQKQKKLIDYQFELFRKAQEESDQKFVDMTRQMLNECNDKFQSFVSNLLSK
uniref:Myb/SANT-like DNA-binding domain-containing protein n=1 Tax=Anopheles culicifacies TaxID=139723 RepID=A0A182LVU2_9DIPT